MSAAVKEYNIIASYMSITPLSNFDDLHTTDLIDKIVVRLLQWKGVLLYTDAIS